MHAIIIWSACERWALFDFVIMVQCTSKCVHSPPNISRKFPSFIVNREKTINRTGVIGLIIIPSWPNKTLLHILWQHKLFNLNILLGLGQILPGNFTSSQKKINNLGCIWKSIHRCFYAPFRPLIHVQC